MFKNLGFLTLLFLLLVSGNAFAGMEHGKILDYRIHHPKNNPAWVGIHWFRLIDSTTGVGKVVSGCTAIVQNDKNASLFVIEGKDQLATIIAAFAANMTVQVYVDGTAQNGYCMARFIDLRQDLQPNR